jgi:hypothetical protein
MWNIAMPRSPSPCTTTASNRALTCYPIALALTGALLVAGAAAQEAPTPPGAATARRAAIAEIIPEDRLPLPGTWETAGVEGGIPTTNAVCADVTQAPYAADKSGQTSATAAIQRAIDRCPPGQVVRVPAGRYKIDARLKIGKSVVVRGAGRDTVFEVSADNPVLMQGAAPWPPPKNNPAFRTEVSGARRGSRSVTVANPSAIRPGMMILFDEEDDPALVWTKSGAGVRARSSLHLVERKDGSNVTFRPALPIDYTRSPRASWFPDVLKNAGIENIRFDGNGSRPNAFIEIYNAWNVWVSGSEFSQMPSKSIQVAWSGHVELRKNLVRDQSNGGPNSEAINLLADVSWSLVVDNICSAGGFPGINLGDGGASPNYSGGFGNVVAYNYCVDSYYTDPPTSPNHGIMAADISGNHSPHFQHTLFEGNFAGKFGADGYHGSGSHGVLFRNVFTGRNKWKSATNRTAIQIDRRNLHYSIVGNTLGEVGAAASSEFVDRPGWTGSTIFRLGYPDIGNGGFAGTFPPTTLRNGDGGPRDLYVDRTTTPHGTTLIEGNWTSPRGKQDWSGVPRRLPDSLFLTAKPAWFGSLAWPPVDPAKPVTNDPTIIPAGYRFIHGKDPPGIAEQPR